MNRKSFEELGRDADLAVRNVANAKRTVIEAGAEMFDRVSVEIRGADWENGLFHLREHLTAVVRDHLTELLPEAVRRMEADATRGLEALKEVLQGGDGPVIEEPRQVPRQALDASQSLTDATRVAMAGTGFTTAEQKADHEASVASTPPAGSGYAAGTAAPSGPTCRADPVSTARRLQPADFRGVRFGLDQAQAELFEQVLVGTKVPARGPVAARLLALHLCEKSDKTASAALVLAPLGQEWADQLKTALQDLPL